MTEFSDYQERIESTMPELFLGRLAWYAITEQSFADHDEVCRMLLTNGVSDILPPAPRNRDVFKRACTSSQVKRIPTDQPNQFVNYLIREVGKDSENVWRRLVAETVDTEGRTLGYEEVFELHFAQRTSSINATSLVGDPAPAALAVVQAVRDEYAAKEGKVTPYTLRELIRKTLGRLNSTVLRDGVYFVREAHYDTVAGLEAFISDLPGGSTFHSLPLVDDRKQREMLRRSFEAESIGEVDRLLGEFRTINSGSGKITAERFSGLKVQADELRAKVADYSDLLDMAMEETASRLEILDRGLFEILGKVKVK